MPADPQPLLLDRLREAGLLEPSTLDELATLREAADPDPRALGKVLFTRRLLSKWQINLLAQGRGKELHVGPYALLDKLGEGGMGQVFKARHRHMSRTVALKVIRKERLANADSVKRFYQEVQAAAALQHPNIVLAYDAGQAGATHYFAMEYVEGDDLARQVKDGGPLPVAVACEYARQAALGLQHAHDKGLTHRDIKPHNLLVARAGGPVVKLLDMGLARLSAQGETGLTQSGQVLGTPDYIAPEQAFDSRAADARSDVYSLGCTLYFLLTGSAPFTGDSLTQVLLKHQMEQALPLSSRRPDVPPALSAVVAKMMAKAPDERYQTAAEVAAALEPFSRGEAGVPPPPPARSPARDAGGDTWAGLDEGDGLIKPSSRSHTRLDEPEAPRRRKPTREEADAPTNKYLLIGAAVGVPLAGLLAVGLAFALWPSGQPAGAPGKPKVAVKDGKPETPKDGDEVPKDGDKDGRPELPKDPPERMPRQLAEHEPVAPGRLVISRDGRWVTSAAGDKGAVRLDARANTAEAFGDPEDKGTRTDLDFLPDGTRALTVTRSGAVQLVEAATGKLVQEFDPVPANPSAVRVSPDGTLAAVAAPGPDSPGRIHLIDVAARKTLRAFDKHGSRVTDLGFTPDGKRVVSVDDRNGLRVWNAADATEVRSDTLTAPSRSGVALAPDGRHALLVTNLGVVWWDVEAGREARSVPPGEPFRIFTGGALAADGRHALVLSVTWENDGTRQLMKDGRAFPRVSELNVVDMHTGRTAGRFAVPHGVTGVAGSPDGRRAYTGGADGKLRVWALDGLMPAVESPAGPAGKPLAKHPIGANGPLAGSPDGRWVVASAAGGLQRLEVGTGALTKVELPGGPTITHVQALAGGERVVLGAMTGVPPKANRFVRVVEAATGKTLRESDPIPGRLTALDVSPDGGTAAVASVDDDGPDRTGRAALRLIDLGTGKVRHTLDKHREPISGVRFSPDGKRVYALGGFFLRVWDADDGSEVRSDRLPTGCEGVPALSPDGKRAALRSPFGLVWWDVERGELVKRVAPEGEAVFLNSAGWSDGRHVAAVTFPRPRPGVPFSGVTLRLIDLEAGKTVREFPHETFVHGVVVAPDGKRLYAADQNGALNVWSLDADRPAAPPSPAPAGKALASHNLGAGPLALSADGRWLATTTLAGGLRRVDAGTGAVGATVSGGQRFSHYAWLPDGKQVLASSRGTPRGGGKLLLLDLTTGATVREFEAPPNQVSSLDVSPDGRWAAVATGTFSKEKRGFVDNVISVYNVATGAVARKLEKHEDRIVSVSFAAGGKKLVSHDQKRRLCVWQVSDGAELAAHRVPYSTGRAAAVSADGTRAAFSGAVKMAWVGLERGEVIREVATAGAFEHFTHVAAVREGAQVAAASHLFKNDGTNPVAERGMLTPIEHKVRLFDSATGTLAREIPHEFEVRSLVGSADGTRLYTLDTKGVVHVWDLGGEKAPEVPKAPTPTPAPKGDRFVGHVGAVNAVAVTADGSKVATGGQDGTIRVWDAASGKEVRKFTHRDPIRSLGFGPRGESVCATDSGGADHLHNLDGGGRSGPRRKEPAEACLMLPGGTHLVVGRGNRVYMEPQDAGTFFVPSIKTGTVRSLAALPDAGTLAVGDTEGWIHSIDVSSGRVTATVRSGHTGPVLALAYGSPRLASAGADGLVYARNVNPKFKPIRFNGHAGPVHAVAVTADGRYVVSGGKDKTVRVWSVGKLIEVKKFTGHEDAVNGVAILPKPGKILSVGDGVREWNLPAEAMPKP